MGLRYFANYAGPDIRFVDLNVIFCEEYRTYLLSGPALGQRQKRISVNTAVSYFNKFKAVLKAAYKVGLLSQNINDLVNPIKDEETYREFITIEEFQKLAETKVKNELLKRAALFSGMTGLRFSDVHALTWSHVRGTADNYYIQFKQEKTAIFP
jgi:integrase